jgi:hypothetical protein
MRNLTLGFDSFVHDEWGYGGDDRHLNLDKGASKFRQEYIKRKSVCRIEKNR